MRIKSCPAAARRKKSQVVRRILLAIAAIPALYLTAALIGSLIAVNRGWSEPDEGITIYLRSNGVHVDLILPADAQRLDWSPLLPERDFARPPPEPNGSASAPASGGSISKRRAGATSSRRPSGRG